MSEKMKLSPPWIIYYKEIEALFGDDPDIKIEYDEDEYIIRLYVTGQDKADALTQLLPAERMFGKIKVCTIVVPANKEATKADLIRRAFEGNPAFSYAVTAEGIFANPITYTVFKNKVIQIWNDSLSDIHGNMSTLYQEIAKDIFGEIDGVFFNTDLPGNPGV